MPIRQICCQAPYLYLITTTEDGKYLIARRSKWRMNVRCGGGVAIFTNQRGANAGQHINGKGFGIAVERRHAKAARAVINREALVKDTLTIRQQHNDRVWRSHGVGPEERSRLNHVPSADRHITTFDPPGSPHCPGNPSGRCRVFLRPNERNSNRYQAEDNPARHGFREVEEVRHRHS